MRILVDQNSRLIELNKQIIDVWGGFTKKLREYPNIGKEVEKQLIAVEICTIEELRKIGSEQAWLKLKEIDPSACLHRLLALEGAIQGVKKQLIDERRKNELKKFFELYKRLNETYR